MNRQISSSCFQWIQFFFRYIQNRKKDRKRRKQINVIFISIFFFFGYYQLSCEHLNDSIDWHQMRWQFSHIQFESARFATEMTLLLDVESHWIQNINGFFYQSYSFWKWKKKRCEMAWNWQKVKMRCFTKTFKLKVFAIYFRPFLNAKLSRAIKQLENCPAYIWIQYKLHVC